MVTKERKNEILKGALQARAGLIIVAADPEMQQPAIKPLIEVLQALVDGIIELTEE